MKRTDEEREQYFKKERETFCAVRDILKESGNKWAANMCYKTPWKFYGTHSVDECVKILLEKYTVDASGCGDKMDGKDGEGNE